MLKSHLFAGVVVAALSFPLLAQAQRAGENAVTSATKISGSIAIPTLADLAHCRRAIFGSMACISISNRDGVDASIAVPPCALA